MWRPAGQSRRPAGCIIFPVIVSPEANAPMYVPRSNQEDRPEVLAAFMHAHPLATLISTGADGALWATHLPVLYRAGPGPQGTIEGHLARANAHHQLVRQAAAVVPARESLVIFTGPDAYVTPTWYPGKHAHGREVPTWNYIAVHAYGTVQLHDDAEWLMAHMTRLTERHEAPRPTPWAVADAPAEYLESQMRATVGIEFTVTRLEARWKMSQNRSHADIDAVVEGLASSDRPMDRVVASIVEERRPPR